MKKTINRMMLAAALVAGAAITFSDAAAAGTLKTDWELYLDAVEKLMASEATQAELGKLRAIPTIVFEGAGPPSTRSFQAGPGQLDSCRIWATAMYQQMLTQSFVQLQEFKGNPVVNVSKIQYIHCDVIGH